MRSGIHRASPRRSRNRALAAGLIACLGLGGCSEVDPIEALRERQKAGDYEGTIEPLRELLARHPDDAEANFLYGRALAFTQPNLAGWSLREAMKHPDWLVPAGTQLAYLALASYDFNEVIEVTTRILEHEPENVRVLLMRANAYAHSKQNPELALADAKRILELDPGKTEAYEPLILALLGLERLGEARAALAQVGELLVESDTDEGVLAWHCATTGAFQQESGAIDRARETWAECLDAHPTDLDVVSSALAFYDAQREPERAIEILRTALAGAPGSQYFRVALAQRLQASGEAAEAEAVLLDATRSEDPQLAANAWLDLGKFRQAAGEYEGGADALERAIERMRELGAPSPQALFEYADALVLADRLERALEVAEDLGVPAHRHLIRARVAQKRGDPALALEEFDEGLRLWPDNPWARYYAALAAEQLGDFDRALAEFRNAVRIEPSATDARTRGAALLLAQGYSNAARELLETRVEEAPLELDGLLLAMRLHGIFANTLSIADYFARVEADHPAWAGHALAEAAEGLNRRAGPALALDMLIKAPGVDYADPRYAVALRALVRFAHDAGEAAAIRATLGEIFAAGPDSSAFESIRGLDLELAGAPAERARAAYARALELAPTNAWALAGLGRLVAGDEPAAALDFFDRAASADPSEPELKLAAARALIASGEPEEAAARLDAMLRAHPFEAEAAAERVRLDLARGIATPETVERARRAVRFGGGAEALELLSRVHTERDEPELAARAAEAARAQREAAAAEG